jgi:small-conductance mechanosensitive channel
MAQELLSLIISPEKLVSYAARALSIAFSLFVIYLFYRLIVLGLERGIKKRLRNERLTVLFSLTRSALRYAAFFIMCITVLQQMGINVTALLAGAGILGLAVSFGSQNLVRDLIAGLFIVLEDQYAIGDEVLISGVRGKVEKMSLRLTVIRGEDGTIYSIPNGNISLVQRLSR